MSREEVEQVARLLQDMGFTVEWFDPEADTFLVRAAKARR